MQSGESMDVQPLKQHRDGVETLRRKYAENEDWLGLFNTVTLQIFLLIPSPQLTIIVHLLLCFLYFVCFLIACLRYAKLLLSEYE